MVKNLLLHLRMLILMSYNDSCSNDKISSLFESGQKWVGFINALRLENKKYQNHFFENMFCVTAKLFYCQKSKAFLTRVVRH